MDYLNDNIKFTIDKLRELYPNDNTFKSYTNILSVISSHFKELNHIFTKVGKLVNKKVQEKREENEVDEGDEGKIISIKPDDIHKNLESLKTLKIE